MPNCFQFISSSRYLILSLNRFDHGLQVQKFPLDESSQNLVGILHFFVHVVQPLLQMLLLLVLEKNELVCILILAQANLGHVLRLHAT